MYTKVDLKTFIEWLSNMLVNDLKSFSIGKYDELLPYKVHLKTTLHITESRSKTARLLQTIADQDYAEYKNMHVVECSRFVENAYFRRLLVQYCRSLMILIVVHDTKGKPVPELNLSGTFQYSILTNHAQRKEAMYYRIHKYIPVSA